MFAPNFQVKAETIKEVFSDRDTLYGYCWRLRSPKLEKDLKQCSQSSSNECRNCRRYYEGEYGRPKRLKNRTSKNQRENSVIEIPYMDIAGDSDHRSWERISNSVRRVVAMNAGTAAATMKENMAVQKD